jgi:alanine-glyoxylate transaminase/serine-glyoxylate transaminase/serine-pyruvate transaminase
MSLSGLNPPERLLLGPGPSNVDPRVKRALSSPLVGYMDPYYLQAMDETGELLRYLFRTENKLTFAVPGTGMAGMEAAICNILEAGDELVVGVNGFFSERMCEIASRIGGKTVKVMGEWGEIVAKEAVEEALRSSDAKAIAVVQGETSTGVLQPIEELSKLAREYDALLIVDAVTSLGGCELNVDAWSVDVCFSASQKCLNCPPGLAPITLSESALNVIMNRKIKVPSFYLDLPLIYKYWSDERVYHHTGPVSMVYALREALRIVREEGIEARWARHGRNSRAFISGIEALGMGMHAQEGHRLPSLNTVKVPEGVSDLNVRRMLLEDFKIEVGAGLGALKGKIWRVGLMGLNSSERNVIIVLEALERALKREGYPIKLGEGVGAATGFYDSA